MARSLICLLGGARIGRKARQFNISTVATGKAMKRGAEGS